MPEFVTQRGYGHLSVARIPSRADRPEVNFEDGKTLRRYKSGERLTLNCSSIGGYPPPNITWFINGEKVKIPLFKWPERFHKFFYRPNAMVFRHFG